MSRHYMQKTIDRNHTVASHHNRKVVSLNVVRRIPRTRLTLGTVVWAHIPFADGTGEKARPAVVVSRQGRNIELMPATTSARRFRYPHRYFEIRDLVAAGLDRATGVSLRSTTVDVIEIVSIAGSLGPCELTTHEEFDVAAA